MAAKGKKINHTARERTKRRIRKQISGTDARPRLTVFKSGKHIYVQAIDDAKGETLASASTLDADVKKRLKDGSSSKSVEAGKQVGLLLAEKFKAKSIVSAVFDRNGFPYSGRVAAIAEGVREGGVRV